MIDPIHRRDVDNRFLARLVQAAANSVGADVGDVDGWGGARTLRGFSSGFLHPRRELTLSAIDAGAARLGVHPAHLLVVSQVESGGRTGFYGDGHPLVLFERHLFSRFTGGCCDRSHPALSSPTPGGYGPSRVQPARLAAARALDEPAAIRATSYGMFQVLGSNFESAGFDSPEEYEAAQWLGADRHLDAMVGYCMSRGLAVDLRRRDWREVARKYNGEGYAAHGYHTRLEEAWQGLPVDLRRDAETEQRA